MSLSACSQLPKCSATLPIIDISPWIPSFDVDAWPPTEPQLEIASQIHRACCDIGFFYIKGFGITRTEMDEAIAVTRKFYESPDVEKQNLSIRNEGSKNARGYQKIGENVTQYKADWHEGLDFYKPVTPEEEASGKPLHGRNQWPSNPPDFRSKIEAWQEKMLLIGMILVKATCVGLGMDEYEWQAFKGSVDDSFWVMRCIGYPSLPPDHNGISCGDHKDYGCYTLLHASEETGALQVQDRTGKYVNADPLPDALVINIGEMWSTWTNRLYKATLHRVVHKGSSYRISIPFFFEPNFDAVIEPLAAALRIQEARNEAVQPLKQSLVYGEFLVSKVSGNFSKES